MVGWNSMFAIFIGISVFSQTCSFHHAPFNIIKFKKNFAIIPVNTLLLVMQIYICFLVLCNTWY